MALRVIITVLCGVGLYVSIFMLRKTARANQGLLVEPSVVQSPRARFFGGIPNAALGIVYYALLATGTWSTSPALAWILCAAALAAAATSAALAYSLLFVTRMPCVYCWTSHVVNWILAVLAIVHLIHLRGTGWR